MIQFEILNISRDSKNIRIQASVKSDAYFDDVYIDSIVIDNLNTYVSAGPSSNPRYSETFSGDVKTINIVLEDAYILDGLKNNIMYVYILAKGTPAPDTPCGEDNVTTLGVAYNLYPFYINIMKYMKSISNNCEIPKEFINAFLLMKGIEMAVKTANYVDANNLWKLITFKQVNTNYNCGCNG